MTELLTAAQMRAIETAAIESGQVTGLELMERAGRGVVEAIFEEWPELSGAPAAGGEGGVAGLAEEGGVAPRPAASPQDICEKKKFRAVVLCGPGNNGGDGFVVARLLKERGWEVEVFLYGDAGKLPPDARANYERWLELGEVAALSKNAFRHAHRGDGGAYRDIYVDALFGTGLARALQGEAFEVIRHMSGVDGDHYSDRIVSIDAPSGLCLDSGRVLAQDPNPLFQAAFEAQGREPVGAQPFFDRFAALTVAFDLPKVGHFIAQGPSVCGKVRVKDIGLENWRVFQKVREDKPAFIMTERGPTGACRRITLKLIADKPLIDDVRDRFPDLMVANLRKYSGSKHKFTYGHALILSGGPGRTGAARMAARGALRIGAGLVTLAVPPAAQQEVAAQVTAIMLRRVGDATALAKVLEDARFNAIGLGPALGLDEEAAALVAAALVAGRATVLDADALTLLARDDALFARLHENCVLTPHAGEFKRLFPDIAAKLEAVPVKGAAYSKVDAAREAAKRAGCVVLFKGPDTVIAAPDGRCSINSAQYDRGAPWLATAGSGDVLTGYIAGLLARGFAPQQAAETAAWLHVECALDFGPGLIAEDLPEHLPNVLRRLLSRP